jgi:RIO kinase 1
MSIDATKYRLLESKIDSLKQKDKDTERRKTYDDVFDENTLLTMYKLFSENVLDILEYTVATGKEGNVFKGKSLDGGSVAVKIYRTSNATFKHLSKYMVGDVRFSGIKRQSRNMIHMWAQNEYRNLDRMFTAKVRVPKPITCRDNVLVMEYLGDERGPAPVLRTTRIKDPQKTFVDIAGNMKRMHKAGLVHGDLSEYNILIWKNKGYFIDVAQAVPLDHPMAEERFQRDVKNIARYFNGLRVETSESDLRSKIEGE